VSEWIEWQGYLVIEFEDSYIISSSFKSDNTIVFGYDSNYTTLAISLIKYLQINGFQIAIKDFDENLDEQSILAATKINNLTQTTNLLCHDEALVAVTKSESFPEYNKPTQLNQIDKEKFHQMNQAWSLETNEMNISQGAYVSQQQYHESLNSRLGLQAQSDEQLIWPPRQLTNSGQLIAKPNFTLQPSGKIISWTKLSAAGAPSEFTIRAPILGGLYTVMVQFSEGPKGVFLLVDDEEKLPAIDQNVEFVVRILYGQEGILRYGLKARIL